MKKIAAIILAAVMIFTATIASAWTTCYGIVVQEDYDNEQIVVLFANGEYHYYDLDDYDVGDILMILFDDDGEPADTIWTGLNYIDAFDMAMWP